MIAVAIVLGLPAVKKEAKAANENALGNNTTTDYTGLMYGE